MYFWSTRIRKQELEANKNVQGAQAGLTSSSQPT